MNSPTGSSGNKEDLNINDWSVGELLHLLQLDSKDVTVGLIDSRVDASITKAKLNLDQAMVTFLLQVRTKLVNAYSTEAQGTFNRIVGNEIRDIHGDSAPERPPGNKFVSTFDLPVVTGPRNPVLRNTMKKLLFINSSQRPSLSPSSSNFNLTLKFPLRRIISMTLDTLTLPTNIPNIGKNIGNAFFRIASCEYINTIKRNETYPPQSSGLAFIPDTDIGYLFTAAYDLSSPDSIATINSQIASYISTVLPTTTPNPNNLYLYRTLPSGRIFLDLPADLYMIWWSTDIADEVALLLSKDTSNDKRFRLNIPTVDRNLGTLLGFKPSENNQDDNNPTIFHEYTVLNITTSYISSTSGLGYSYPNFDSLNYVFLSLNDFQHSQSSDNIIGCNNESDTIDYPEYQKLAHYTPLDPTESACDPLNVNEVAVPTLPFSLTKAQLFTLNAIRLGRKNLPIQAPDDNKSKNVLAMIPLKKSQASRNMKEIYSSSTFTASKRDYFGTVKIGRLEVSLTDERGMIIDLDGQDWSCVIVIESLYQF